MPWRSGCGETRGATPPRPEAGAQLPPRSLPRRRGLLARECHSPGRPRPGIKRRIWAPCWPQKRRDRVDDRTEPSLSRRGPWLCQRCAATARAKVSFDVSRAGVTTAAMSLVVVRRGAETKLRCTMAPAFSKAIVSNCATATVGYFSRGTCGTSCTWIVSRASRQRRPARTIQILHLTVAITQSEAAALCRRRSAGIRRPASPCLSGCSALDRLERSGAFWHRRMYTYLL
jgi:hypothetical protein